MLPNQTFVENQCKQSNKIGESRPQTLQAAINTFNQFLIDPLFKNPNSRRTREIYGICCHDGGISTIHVVGRS